MMKNIALCFLLSHLVSQLSAQAPQAEENQNILSMGGNSSEPIVIDAEDSVVCDEAKNNCIATGNARAQRGNFVVNGQTLTVYFKGSGHDRDIREVLADGNVSLINPSQVAYGEHAHYDVAQDRLIMTGGDLKLVTENQVITARDSLEFWNSKNIGIARGNAIARFPKKEQIVEADTLVAFFLPKEERKKDENGEEKTSLKRIEAEGNVLVSTPKEIASGDRGVYIAANDTSELFGNVKITQGGNHIRGAYAIMNMKTNLAQLYSHNPNDPASSQKKQRIRGIIIPKEAKQMRGSKDPEKS